MIGNVDDYDSLPMMTVMQAQSLRKLVDMVNDENIQKDDIVELFHDEEGFILIYYK